MLARRRAARTNRLRTQADVIKITAFRVRAPLEIESGNVTVSKSDSAVPGLFEIDSMNSRAWFVAPPGVLRSAVLPFGLR